MIRNRKGLKKPAAVTLRALSEYVGLTPGTVSVVLNRAPSSKSIPRRTQDRIFAAAAKLNYQPNFLARILRTGRLATDDAGRACGALVVNSAEHLKLAIHALESAGLRVPDDVSVVGFGEVSPTIFARPVASVEVHPP